MWWLQYLVLLTSVSKPAAASFQKWDIEKGAVCSQTTWTASGLKSVQLRYCDRPPSPASLINTSHHYRGLFYSDERTFIYFLPLPLTSSSNEDIDSEYYMAVDSDCNYYNVVKLKNLEPGQSSIHQYNTETCTEGR